MVQKETGTNVTKGTYIIEAAAKKTSGLKIDGEWFNMNPLISQDFRLANESVFTDLGPGDKVEISGDLANKKYNIVELKVKQKPINNQGGNWGKDVQHLKDLLKEAHAKGLNSIKTEMISVDWEKKTALFKATVYGKEDKNGNLQTFEAHGDTTQENIESEKVQKAWIRMAETRAISRALRWFLGRGEVVDTELPEGEDVPIQEEIVDGNKTLTTMKDNHNKPGGK